MIYAAEEYLHLRIVPNPDNDCGFDVVENSSGRPIAGITNIKITKGVGTPDVRTQPPQQVEITMLGIPVMLSLPDWNEYYRERLYKQEAQEAARKRAEFLSASQSAEDLSVATDSLSLPSGE